ncbi:MAG: enolase C-terminal domain-like protein [Candidatus Acidiferrales bacterium]
MTEHRIVSLEARDLSYPLHEGAGSDSVHSGSSYAFATTLLGTGGKNFGTGIVLTLGLGNELVCDAIEMLGGELIGREIEELMADFGTVSRRLAEHPQLRWLGPHKGVVHLALASITNACFDLWAKARGVPLWRLLLDLTPKQIVNLLDLSYLEEVLTAEEAERVLREGAASRGEREPILRRGYPGYDTSVGWFQYDDTKVKDLARNALAKGFRAFKLKVGSHEGERDVRRAFMLRKLAGADALVMLDVNQQWNLPTAIRMCGALRDMKPYFIEEPTHPDDVQAHRTLAEAIAPMRIALGEHVPNRIMFKNFMQASALHFVQADCTRLAGISEFITVSLLARKFDLPVVPHVGDMGQIHQHLVLFNHIAIGHEALFLECIPHMREHFVHPSRVEGGVYVTPQEPGSTSDLAGVSPSESARR